MEIKQFSRYIPMVEGDYNDAKLLFYNSFGGDPWKLLKFAMAFFKRFYESNVNEKPNREEMLAISLIETGIFQTNDEGMSFVFLFPTKEEYLSACNSEIFTGEISLSIVLNDGVDAHQEVFVCVDLYKSAYVNEYRSMLSSKMCVVNTIMSHIKIVCDN